MIPNMLVETKQIVISNILPGGGAAFGVTEDHEDVFISGHLYKSSPVEIGGIYDVIIIPNSNPRTPWQAIKITATTGSLEDDTLQPKAPLRERIMTLLNDEPECFFAVKHIMESLDLDIGHTEVLRELDGLHALSFICKAEVYGPNNRKRPSFNLYSKSLEAFDLEDNDT